MNAELLAPVSRALLARAQEQATAVQGAAAETVNATMAKAEADVQQILADARGQAAADAAVVARYESGRGRREARTVVLSAQRDAYDTALSSCRQAVKSLVSEADYPKWREGLAKHAIAVLGHGAVLEDLADGGITAAAEGRRIDLSLSALAESCLVAEYGSKGGDQP